MDSPCVMVVDDDPDIRHFVQAALEEAGHQVVSAPNGASALELLHDGMAPRAMLLDLMMPGVNGFETVQTMRTDLRLALIPVALLTAYPSLARDAADLDNLEIFTKPVDIEELTEFASRYCRGPGRHRRAGVA